MSLVLFWNGDGLGCYMVQVASYIGCDDDDDDEGVIVNIQSLIFGYRHNGDHTQKMNSHR